MSGSTSSLARNIVSANQAQGGGINMQNLMRLPQLQQGSGGIPNIGAPGQMSRDDFMQALMQLRQQAQPSGFGMGLPQLQMPQIQSGGLGGLGGMPNQQNWPNSLARNRLMRQ